MSNVDQPYRDADDGDDLGGERISKLVNIEVLYTAPVHHVAHSQDFAALYGNFQYVSDKILQVVKVLGMRLLFWVVFFGHCFSNEEFHYQVISSKWVVTLISLSSSAMHYSHPDTL